MEEHPLAKRTRRRKKSASSEYEKEASGAETPNSEDDTEMSNDECHKSSLAKLIEYLNFDQRRPNGTSKTTTNNEKNWLTLDFGLLFNETWTNFNKIRQVYSIKNDQMNWLSCLLYLAYEKQLNPLRKKSSCPPTEKSTQLNNRKNAINFAKPAEVYEYPILSINKLLKFSQLNFPNFMNKMKKTIQILNASEQLSFRIENLEIKYNVSSVLYGKYNLIFNDVFKCSNLNFISVLVEFENETSETWSSSHRFNIKRDEFYDTNDLFKFGWNLFIFVKEHYPQISTDLVNSFHILICSISYIYKNVIDKFYESNSDVTSHFLNYICKKYNANLITVKTINEHYFKTQLAKNRHVLFPNCLAKNFNDENDQDQHKELTADSLDYLDLNNIKIIYSNLNTAYECLIQRNNNSNSSSFTTFHMDERIFFDLNISMMMPTEQREDQESNSYRTLLVGCKYDLKISNCLLNIFETSHLKDFHFCLENSFALGELSKNEQTEYVQFLNKIINDECSQILKKSLLDSLVLNLLKFEDSVSLENERGYFCSIIDSLVDFSVQFFNYALEQILCNEKKRFSSEQYIKTINNLVMNEIYHKSIYVICFEILLNFIQISIKEPSSHPEVTYLVDFLCLNSNKNLHFPWSLKNVTESLKAFDLFRTIELFIRSLSVVQTLNSASSTSSTSSNGAAYLDKNMIRYLNTCEEKILEYLAWESDSTLWVSLNSLKLSSNGSTENELAQYKLAFPLFDDIFTLNSLTNLTNNYLISNNLAKNSTNNDLNNLSIKHHPTITRVVCSSTSTNSAATSNTKQIQVLTLTPGGTLSKTTNATEAKKSANNRLVNLKSYLSYFFRKFYNLANARIKYFIEKLDLVNLYIEVFNLRIDQPQSPSAPQTPTTSFTSALTMTPNGGVTSSSHAQLTNETYQMIFRKTWHIFEYSISGAGGEKSLLQDRHLDQLIMCSIYISCKINQIPVQFKDIIRVYRCLNSNSKSQVYREVLIQNEREDLINFYNKIYCTRLKAYTLELNSYFKWSNTNSNHQVISLDSKGMLSPVGNTPSSNSTAAKLQNINTFLANSNTQFSPRKVLNEQSIFISPVKSNHASSSLQPLHNRNKLIFSLNDLNQLKSIESINEMIRKNEIKIKTSNKRLFSEISSQNVWPTTANQPAAPLTAVVACNPTVAPTTVAKATSAEDETDGRIKFTKINSFNRMSSNGSNFISRMVTSKLASPSTNNSNLITMVIGSNSSSSAVTSSSSNFLSSNITIGANFAKKLQTLKNEKATL